LTLATKSFKANDPQAAKITTSVKVNEGSILQLPILSANVSWPEF
jgi:urease accessory protein UreH